MNSSNDSEKSDAISTTLGQKPVVLLGLLTVGAILVLGIVILFIPLVDSKSSPAPESSQVSGDSLPLNAEPATNELSSEDAWKLPLEPDAIPLDSLKQEMLAEVTRVEQQFPNSAKAFDLCASVYYDLNQLSDADRQWKASLALDSNNAEIYLNYAAYLIGIEKPQEAIGILETAHAKGFETAESYLELAKANEGAGDFSKAAEISQEVTRRFPDIAESWFLSGRLLKQLGQYAESESCLRRAQALDYPEQEILPLLISVLARQAKREEAHELEAKFKAMLKPAADEGAELQPFQVKFEASLRERAARFYFLVATLEREAGNRQEMLRLVKRSLELKPNDSTPLVFLAEYYRKQNRLDEAIEIHKRLIEIEPENILHFSNMAALAFGRNDQELAVSAMKQGLQFHPDNEALQLALAKIYIGQKRPLEARALMLAAIEKSQNPEVYMVLAASYQQVGNMKEAQKLMEQARKMSPNFRFPK